MKDLHLITKILFDPDFYTPESFVKVKTGDYISNGLIVSNNEEELVVVGIRKVLIGDEYKTEAYTQTIQAEQVANGEIELIFPEEGEIDAKSIDNAYIAFKETSSLLCEREHELADSNKVKDQSAIDERHENRMLAFQKLIIDFRN